MVEYQITGLEGHAVQIQTRVFDQGKPLGLPATREERRDLDPVKRQAMRFSGTHVARRQAIRAAGVLWDAILYEDRWTDEDIAYVRRTWVSADAPVLGIIRMELIGDGELESMLALTAHGREALP